LACFLNSSALDSYFRVFSGHTQVNATDLRNMAYPSLVQLKMLGSEYRGSMRQEEIDILIAVQQRPAMGSSVQRDIALQQSAFGA
jgi:adenine-specific DNA-methyltransferase